MRLFSSIVTFLRLLPVAWSGPRLLVCESDDTTRMRRGQHIMGVPVGADATGSLNMSILRDGVLTSVFSPHETLTVLVDGLPSGSLFAIRVSDGGGRLTSAPNSLPLTNQCATQVYNGDPADGNIVTALLITPDVCGNAPDKLTVSVVSSKNGLRPMLFAQHHLQRGKGWNPALMKQCPSTTPPPYPWNPPPVSEKCPNGAAAQHGAPCPGTPCVSPPGKPGTCLTSDQFDGSIPDSRRGSAINAESKIEELVDDVTPISHHYVTGSAPPPRALSRNMTDWQLLIDGEVHRPQNFTMDALKSFSHVSRRYVLECAGNWGRGIAAGRQQADWWTIGAAGCAEWTGVLLRDVLHSLGVRSSAVYVAYYGEDVGGYSRGIPIEKALDGHTMLAWAMNGEDLPAYHGFPLRLLAPGFPGSAQGKWLRRLWIRDQVHDGLGMNGKSYRVAKFPIRPGRYNAPDSWFKIFTQQPVRSLIVRPPRCTVTHSRVVQLEGKAWSGAGDITKVEVSYDVGLTWTVALLSSPFNKWAWQSWAVNISVPSHGLWNFYARATDHTGATQPMLVPSWNPGGYGNNQAMQVDVEVLPFQADEDPQEDVAAVAQNDDFLQYSSRMTALQKTSMEEPTIALESAQQSKAQNVEVNAANVLLLVLFAITVFSFGWLQGSRTTWSVAIREPFIAK